MEMVVFLSIICLLIVSVRGHILEDVLTERKRQSNDVNDGSRTPTIVWMAAEETAITVRWTPPSNLNDVSYCMLAYQADYNPVIVRILLRPNQQTKTIENLDRNTLYNIKLYCLYGGEAGPSTRRFRVVTRIVSVDPPICPGTLPHAALEPYCLEYPDVKVCKFTCQDGYRKSDILAVLRSFWTGNNPAYVFCENGTWVTHNERHAYGINDICLPNAEWEKCPLSIPHGALEPHCGPATDWLCRFTCDGDASRHPYMSGILKNFLDLPYMLYCDNGIWKTGYEALGVDVSGVCRTAGLSCTNSDEIPNGRLLHPPCPSLFLCGFACDEGFHKHALSGSKPFCENGHLGLRTTKYDQSVTPETLCVPDDARGVCPKVIPNGRIADSNCTTDCLPDCDEGYYLPGRNGPDALSCEGGKWLTDEPPYNSDNICFPDGGHICSLEIPNGITINPEHYRRDDGTTRSYQVYKCNEGFRRHRSMHYVECIAGKWVTGQERFGLNLSSLCIPY